MEQRNTHSGFTITGRIDMRVHDVSTLRESVDDWDSLSKEEKLDATRVVNADYEDTVYNVTTDELHEYFVGNLDPSQTAAENNVSVSHLALGTDGSSGTSTSDTDLNNRVYNEAVTDIIDNSKELLTSTFLDSSEANGNVLDELGLYTGDPANLANADVFMMNHSAFSSITKDNSKTVTFDVTLTFGDA